MRVGTDPRGFWNTDIGDVFHIKPWEMGRVSLGEYVNMHAHVERVAAARAAIVGLGG